MGAIVSLRTGHAWAWQIEHNGGWHWQVGECTHRSASHGRGPGYGRHAPPGAVTGAYIALLGPADAEHHWCITLRPGDSFTTVPASVAVSSGGFDGAVAGLTAVRRAIRRPHEDHRQLPVIFNDYMNTLMGNPTTDRLLPLITAAAGAGAEYFCIDSGWYADIDDGWWDTVGAWKPSRNRFPGGFGEVLDHIRAAGMVPGLWLEPEVVGLNSPVVAQLPHDAFFQRSGRPIVEHGRYHLDLRHPAAVKHLDEVIDFVAGDLGVGYLKLDYNIAVGPGPDTGGLSAGAGLLDANRAHLDWLDAVLDRYPGLVIENCASGGLRTDYALLSRLQLQSTSDQQDHLRYPPIAAAAPAAIAPEQAAVWAYPQPDFTDDEIAFTLCERDARPGQPVRSPRPDEPPAAALVAEAVRVYKQIRARPPVRAVLAARPAPLDRLLDGPGHAHARRRLPDRMAPPPAARNGRRPVAANAPATGPALRAADRAGAVPAWPRLRSQLGRNAGHSHRGPPACPIRLRPHPRRLSPTVHAPNVSPDLSGSDGCRWRAFCPVSVRGFQDGV